jgi:hypothetical protein
VTSNHAEDNLTADNRTDDNGTEGNWTEDNRIEGHWTKGNGTEDNWTEDKGTANAEQAPQVLSHGGAEGGKKKEGEEVKEEFIDRGGDQNRAGAKLILTFSFQPLTEWKLSYGELATVWEFYTSVHVIRARSVCYPDSLSFLNHDT